MSVHNAFLRKKTQNQKTTLRFTKHHFLCGFQVPNVTFQGSVTSKKSSKKKKKKLPVRPRPEHLVKFHPTSRWHSWHPPTVRGENWLGNQGTKNWGPYHLKTWAQPIKKKSGRVGFFWFGFEVSFVGGTSFVGKPNFPACFSPAESPFESRQHNPGKIKPQNQPTKH